MDTSQTKECYNRKLELKEALDYIFRDIFSCKFPPRLEGSRSLGSRSRCGHFFTDIGIYIVGSSSNGFGTNESDVDICMMVSREEVHTC